MHIRPGSASTTEALPEVRSALSVSGESVAVSSLRQVAGGVEVRLVGMSHSQQQFELDGAEKGARETDLLGRVLTTSSLDEENPMLQPWQVLTLLLGKPDVASVAPEGRS